jgi:tRNA(fMet)-specific endonuclease VapC
MDYLLDTNIISLAIKNNRATLEKFDKIKGQNKRLFFSCISYFEIRRGFLAVDAPKLQTIKKY